MQYSPAGLSVGEREVETVTSRSDNLVGRGVPAVADRHFQNQLVPNLQI